MDNKRLFFGVSQKELESQMCAQQKREELAKQREEQEVIAAERLQQEQRAQKQRELAYKKYAGFLPKNTKDKLKTVMASVSLDALCLFVLGSTWWGLFQSYDYDVNNGALEFNGWYKPYKVALHDAYIPTAKYKYGYEYIDGGRAKVTKVENPKFQLTGAWCVNMLMMLTSLYLSIRGVRRENEKYDTVDMMLELEKFGKKYNLNKAKVKRLVSNFGSVIERMSAHERVYFDMLMKGDINIKDQQTMKNMATHIMIGHLESHPEDAEKILSVFNEQTIPESVLSKIQQRSR